MRSYKIKSNSKKPMNKTTKVLLWLFSGIVVIGGILFIPIKGKKLFDKVKEKFTKEPTE